MIDSEKIRQINQLIGKYFEEKKDVQKVPAKNLMPLFIKAGIFAKDHRGGLPIREILRELDAENDLNRIPYVLPERKTKNTYWYFVPTKNSTSKISETPTPKKETIQVEKYTEQENKQVTQGF